jgi:outer membrane protein assembly factor BamE (lipoprotein component of BamABCDE complex)
MKFGVNADAIIAGIAEIGMSKDEVLEAKGEPRTRDSFPPNHELWAYDRYRIAFTEGRVSYAGH